MTLSTSRTTSRREAAVAAALAGAVVVVLGYASGLGVQTSTDQVAVQGPPTFAPPVTVPPVAASPATVAAPPVAVPVAHPAQHIGHAAHAEAPARHDHTPAAVAPGPTPTTAPTPEPAPAAADPACSDGLLGGLPLVGSLTDSLSSLLFGLAAPLDPLVCSLGGVVELPGVLTGTEAGR